MLEQNHGTAKNGAPRAHNGQPPESRRHPDDSHPHSSPYYPVAALLGIPWFTLFLTFPGARDVIALGHWLRIGGAELMVLTCTTSLIIAVLFRTFFRELGDIYRRLVYAHGIAITALFVFATQLLLIWGGKGILLAEVESTVESVSLFELIVSHLLFLPLHLCLFVVKYLVFAAIPLLYVHILIQSRVTRIRMGFSLKCCLL